MPHLGALTIAAGVPTVAVPGPNCYNWGLNYQFQFISNNHFTFLIISYFSKKFRVCFYTKYISQKLLYVCVYIYIYVYMYVCMCVFLCERNPLRKRKARISYIILFL